MKVFYNNTSNIQSFIDNFKYSRVLNEIDKKTTLIATLILGTLALILAGVLYYRCKFKETTKVDASEKVVSPPIAEKSVEKVPEPVPLKPVEVIDQTQLFYDHPKVAVHTVDFGRIGKTYGSTIKYNVFKGTYRDKPVNIVTISNRYFHQIFSNVHPIWNEINHKLPVKILACDRSGGGYGGEIEIVTEPLGTPLWDNFPTNLDESERIKIAEDLANDLKKIQAVDKGYETLYPGSIYFTKSENSIKGSLFYFSDNTIGGIETCYVRSLKSLFGFSFDRAALAAPEYFNESLTKEKDLTKANIFSFGTLLWSIFQGHLPKPEEVTDEEVQEGYIPHPENDPRDIANHLKARKRYFQVNKMIDRIMENWQNLEMPKECPEAIQQLIKKCWSKKPEDRPTIDEIIDVLHNLSSVQTKTKP